MVKAEHFIHRQCVVVEPSSKDVILNVYKLPCWLEVFNYLLRLVRLHLSREISFTNLPRENFLKSFQSSHAISCIFQRFFLAALAALYLPLSVS